MTQEYNYLFKMLLIGNSSVGKSCLLLRFSDDIFSENYISTIGVDFKIKTIDLNGTTVKLQIWDTAGQERFKTITSSYYKGAHGIMIVYDVTDRESFKSVQMWMGEVDKFAAANVNKLLIGNKVDLISERQVTTEEGKALAKEYGIKYIETSAKSSMNVLDSFKLMTSEMHARIMKKSTPKPLSSSIPTSTPSSSKKVHLGRSIDSGDGKKKGGCCKQ